jgi:hypothetical protein
MFERPHHQRIARLLQRLDAGVMRGHTCWFGGGTAIALRYGEYRESLDVDFLVSDSAAFRALRARVHDGGLGALVREGETVPELVKAPRIDADAIRAWVVQEGVEIKFEIVREGRIAFEIPGRRDEVCGLPSLAPVDLAASKLLANVDRGLDDSTFNRDVIDLAMMRAAPRVLAAALAKSAAAYGGPTIREHLLRATGRFRDRPGWLARCLQTMAMPQPEALIWQHLRHLEKRLATPM